MTAPERARSDSTFVSSAERRKRLGQYFTGVGLGRVLAALAYAERAKAIIDPMAGSGDLLASCLQVGAKPRTLAGVEIDPAVRDACIDRLPQVNCILGSAFDPFTIAQLPCQPWDLVIANPPYVRYQSLSNEIGTAQALPSAMQVRTGLLQTLPLLPALDAEDKRLFGHLVSGYSGLSDLAVPSWILCAGLVKQGGRLALVVPESWLTRDYAAIVHYLLFRWFDIEFIVEDEHASWFDAAQVKTMLIVAKRVQRRASALAGDTSYCHIAIAAAAATRESPIGRLGLPMSIPERSFARQARRWLRNAASHSTGHVCARPFSRKLTCRNVIAAASGQKWFAAVDETARPAADGVYVPHDIHAWLSRHGLSPAFETFTSQGVSVGQGLRTGANAFFYARGIRACDHVALTFSGPLAGVSATAPLTIAKPVIRRQSELPAGFMVSARIATGWALDLRAHALPEDLGAVDLITRAPYAQMPEPVANVVRTAARLNFGSNTKPRKIWQLSAVSPNIRPAVHGMPARHWYMLPDFASRHLPDVFLARVNAATPLAYLNQGRECLIDANFSTMWTLPASRWTATALSAFMNSAWAQAVIEKTGAIMGGGALKVEATHLRRFPVPPFDSLQLRSLSELGQELVTSRSDVDVTRDAIDAVVSRALGCPPGRTAELRQIANDGQARRAKHKARRGQSDGDDC